MGRPREYVRVIDHPDGSLERVENGRGREILGLSYNASNRSYYTLDEATGKRRYLGRDLDGAAAEVEENPTNSPEYYVALETDIEIRRAVQCLIDGPIGRETHRPDHEALNRVLDFVRGQSATSDTPHPKPSKERLSDCPAA
jgi:hypothetical protein